uniref:Uncharacterized protein n=1 Tax=Anguilla anguilla TaxID=7936 RepID=A0A0E9R2G4_ANGAN
MNSEKGFMSFAFS